MFLQLKNVKIIVSITELYLLLYYYITCIIIIYRLNAVSRYVVLKMRTLFKYLIKRL